MRSARRPDALLARARILVVDDQEPNLRLLEQVLGRAGFVGVVGTTDPRIAVDLARELQPDLVLLDLRMPGVDGFGVLDALRASGVGAPFLPVLVLTADHDPEAKNRALAMGAEDYLTKPFDAVEVVIRVRNLLELRLLYRAVEERNHELAAQVAAASDELTETRLARESLLSSLERLAVNGDASDTAAAICREIVERGFVDVVSIIALTAPGHGLTLATAGPLAERVPANQPLPADAARYLEERATAGPWTDEGDGHPGALIPGRGGAGPGVRTMLYAPIRTDGLVAVLAAGTSEALAPEQRARRLPVVLEYGAVARALLGRSLDELRNGAGARREIRAILDNGRLSSVFQPVVSLVDGSVLGFEALTRFADGTRPDVRFAEAERVGLGADLECAAIAAALGEARWLPPGAWLSVNVSPSVAVDGRLEATLRDPGRVVVVELTEHSPIDDYDALRRVLARLGPTTRLAIDDAGAGFASFRHILELAPDYVKLDIGLVRSIDADAGRQALVAAMRHFALKTGSTLIAEGIETEAERASLASLGVEFGQGYLLGRPAPAADRGPAPGRVVLPGVAATGDHRRVAAS